MSQGGRLSTYWVVAVMVAALLLVCALPLTISAEAPKASAAWTFMVYLDGDNNLESYGIDDFMEMSSVGSTSQVNILAQFDRSPLTGWSGGSSEYDDWRTAKRFLVQRGDRPTSAYQSSDLGEVNMGSASTLQGFLEWGMDSYPAQRYALVLWDHGGGWVYGVCADDTSSGDPLLLPEIRAAISGAQASTGKRLNLVGFDACLMGMVEVAYDLRELTDVVVFSEETEPGQGWAYDKVLASLTAEPGMDPDQLAASIVEEYSQYYGMSGKETLSSVSSLAMSPVAASLDAFADELAASMAVHEAKVRLARSRAEHFEYEMFVDLYDLANKVRQAAITSPLTAAANQLMLDLDAAVLSETSGSLRPGAHGMAIYFPDVLSDLNLVGYRSDTSLSEDTSWDEFLNIYFNGGGLGATDPFEDDDTYLDAKELSFDRPQYRSIGDGGADVDWAWFSMASAKEVVVATSGVSGDTEMALYGETGAPSNPIAYDDDGGTAYFSRIIAYLEPGTYYVRVSEFGGDSPIETYELWLSEPSPADPYEPDDSPEDASQLMPGLTQVHSIGANGADVDWASFALPEASSVQVETWGTEGDTRIWLYELSGDRLYELETDDDTGVGLFSLIIMNELPVGEYFVRVEDYYNDQEIPSYTLNLTVFSSVDEFEPDDDADKATPLVPGVEQWHSIGDGGEDVDWFSFQLLSASQVGLVTYGAEGDTLVLLYSGSSQALEEVASDDDSGDGYFSALRVGPLSPGPYFVKVQAYRAFMFFGAEPIPRYGIILTTAPSAPTGLTAQEAGGQVLLSWGQPSSDGGSPVVSYDVLRSALSGQSVFYRSVNGTSFLDANVSSGLTYYYTVRAVTSFGKGALSEEVQVAMPGDALVPGPITSIQVEAHSSRVVLSWQPPEDHGSPVLLYHVFRGQEPDGSDRLEVGTRAETTYTDEAVTEGVTYHYWVVAENEWGLGEPSVSAAALAQDPPIGAGTALTIILLGLGVLAVVGLVLMLVVGRRKPSSQQGGAGGAQMPNGVQKCPRCGALSMGKPYCGNCGKKLL